MVLYAYAPEIYRAKYHRYYQRDAELLEDHLEEILQLYLAEAHAAYDHGRGLGAAVTAGTRQRRNGRHQQRNRGERRFVMPDDDAGNSR